MKNTGVLCERKENRLEIIKLGVNFRLRHSFNAHPLARNWVLVSLHERGLIIKEIIPVEMTII